jgi:hypothetical protein
MGRKSSLETLPPKVQAAVIKAMQGGATIDDLVEHLAGLGHPRSRSAVGRYTQQYNKLTERQSDIRVMAEAFGREFGGTDNVEGKLMMQMLTSIGVRMIMPLAAEDDPDLDAKEFNFLAKATKELLMAAKADAERDAKIREATKREAAENAEAAMRATGASADTINKVKAEILGIEA